MIADIRIISQQRYEEYRALVRDAIRANGGRYLVRSGDVKVIEGNWAPPRVVVIEFDNLAGAHAFYRSPVYAQARDVCANAAMLDMVLVEGLQPEPPPHARSATRCYGISDIKTINPERYEEYREFAAAAIERQGGRYLVRDGRVEVLEGGWQPSRLSMVEYVDRAAAQARFASAEFHQSRDLRTNAAMVDMIMVEGLAPGAEI
jgi:uncharacterized protein (DUF1330 family)